MLGTEATTRVDDPEESEDYKNTSFQPIKISLPKDNDEGESEGVGSLSKRIIHICLLFVIICFFGIFIVGISSLNVQNEISEGKSFIKVAEEMRPNFEDSLLIYTGNTQKIIDFLLELRPQTEEEFIAFITTLEKLGKDLSLHLNIKTLDEKAEANDKTKDGSITYNVNFYGSIKDLKSFISALDKIPYYINIANIRYQNLPPQEGANEKKINEFTNISVELKLFTKKINAN